MYITQTTKLAAEVQRRLIEQQTKYYSCFDEHAEIYSSSQDTPMYSDAVPMLIPFPMDARVCAKVSFASLRLFDFQVYSEASNPCSLEFDPVVARDQQVVDPLPT